MRFRPLLTLVTALIPLTALAAVDPRQDYNRLQKWQFSAPVTLAAPVTVTRDTAAWTFQSGSVRFMEPASDGTITGLVFEGQGRFTMTVPDRFEAAQLRRFTKRENDGFDQAFTQLVLRTSDRAWIDAFPKAPAGAAHTPHGLAEKRHEHWLIEGRDDADARILAALLNGTPRTIADMNTADFDWLRYDYDTLTDEEISVTKWAPRLPEGWISLDRAEDRQQDGVPDCAAARRPRSSTST